MRSMSLVVAYDGDVDAVVSVLSDASWKRDWNIDARRAKKAMAPVVADTRVWWSDQPLARVAWTQATTSPSSTRRRVSCAKASMSGITKANEGRCSETSPPSTFA